MLIRQYQGQAEGSAGRDEGGYFRMVEVPDVPDKLQKRMTRCSGCHDAFYNHRANCTGNTCWSLGSDGNFEGQGKPKCFH